MKRYALLANRKPEKLLKVAQESMMVHVYSVGCYHHSCYKVFSGPPIEKWCIQFHAFSILIRVA